MDIKQIDYTKNPHSVDINFLTKKISEETSQYGLAQPFAFFIKDEANKIIAGANGFILYGTIYTDQLWVDENYRRQGLAKKIMNKVHELGKSEGCQIATVQTMDFQKAANFYQKLGYVQDFKRPGYVYSSHCIFMKKDL